MLDKFEDLKKKYEDPMGTVTKLMGEIQDLFKDARTKAKADEALTQKHEELIHLLAASEEKQIQTIAMLDDLIKTLEEKERQQPDPPKDPKPPEKPDPPGEPGTPGGGKPRPSPPNDPSGEQSGGAMVSKLVPGPVKRPPNVTKDHTAAGDGNWAELGKEKAAELENVSRKTRSERYNDVVRDFNRRIAALGSDR
ncbi:MAG: hypothetical protein HZA50_13110, partial [Planctomycetes bacterium]|nr:hypothetical protein [Planctomycetota bacterium]